MSAGCARLAMTRSRLRVTGGGHPEGFDVTGDANPSGSLTAG
jgi:hypothetical protein